MKKDGRRDESACVQPFWVVETYRLVWCYFLISPYSCELLFALFPFFSFSSSFFDNLTGCYFVILRCPPPFSPLSQPSLLSVSFSLWGVSCCAGEPSR